jgi:ribose 5-phosphate isomerase A
VTDVEAEKRAAAQAAALLVRDGDRVGLGTGSTVAYLLPALAARDLKDLRCVATSVATEEKARELGLRVEPFDQLDRLDIAIDGADQIDPQGWLIKGGGGAHTREKIVAAAAERFVVIADSTKTVDGLAPPVPVEILDFGVAVILAAIAPARLRDRTNKSPDGGLLADHLGPVDDPRALATRLSCVPGVVDHGLFSPELVSAALVARGDDIERREYR